MAFEVLHAHGEEGDRWLSLVDKLPSEMRDIHFLPQYGLIYEETYGFEPLLAYFSDDRGFVIQPFVKRSLDELPFLSDQGIKGPYYDIANPYGYGGPVCSSTQESVAGPLLKEFEACLLGYCNHEKLASEFTSLHPFLHNHNLLQKQGLVQVTQQKQVVYFDLTQTEEELWLGMNRGHKSGVNKAKKSNTSVIKVEPTDETFDSFNELYYRTMEWNKAEDRWFFPKNYFSNCYKNLGSGRISIFFAYVGDELASAYLLIHDFTTAYFHFAGSDRKFADKRPNNMLMFETALWAKRYGYLRYHLGGGVSSLPDDNLLRFKMGFTKKTAPIYTYQRILHQETYERLCQHKLQYELDKSKTACKQDYFPMYRR